MSTKRKVTVINSSNQSVKSFEIGESVKTLADLKAACTLNGVPYEGMTFNEGHAKIELSANASLLPTNIPYKGKIVNDLTFMLTKPNKKVSSGLDRAEAYKKIKEANLQDAIKEQFGRNFTQVPTADLFEFIDKYAAKAVKKASKKAPKAAPKAEKVSQTYKSSKPCPACKTAKKAAEDEEEEDADGMFSYLNR